MTTVVETTSLAASPADVWSLIGNFDALDDWHPAVASSLTEQVDGKRVRHLTLGDGAKIVERLDSVDNAQRSYTYTILEPGPLPVQKYQSTIAVTGSGSACQVTWSSKFEPAGASEADAQAAMAGVYTGGFGALVKKFGSS